MGDRVLLHDEPGEIETLADPAHHPDEWLVKEQGGGAMIVEPKVFGRLFLAEPHSYNDLRFVSRQSDSSDVDDL